MIPHGTSSTYTNLGCRCTECRAAWTVYNRGLRRSLRRRFLAGQIHPVHGSASTYNNYGCRCDDCRHARRLAERRKGTTR